MKLKEATKQRAKFRDMSMDQLGDELAKLKREAFNLRFQKATGQLENTTRIGEIRRSVARLKTVIGEKRRAKV